LRRSAPVRATRGRCGRGRDFLLAPLGDGDDVRGLGPLRALTGLVFDLRPFGERLEAVAADLRVMDEQVLTAVLGLDEAVALRVVEPLHASGCHRKHLLYLCSN